MRQVLLHQVIIEATFGGFLETSVITWSTENVEVTTPCIIHKTQMRSSSSVGICLINKHKTISHLQTVVETVEDIVVMSTVTTTSEESKVLETRVTEYRHIVIRATRSIYDGLVRTCRRVVVITPFTRYGYILPQMSIAPVISWYVVFCNICRIAECKTTTPHFTFFSVIGTIDRISVILFVPVRPTLCCITIITVKTL